jgi:hypothetical protein
MAHSEFLNGRRGWGLAQGSVTYSLEPIDEVRILTHKALFCCLKMYSNKKFRFFLIKFPL